MHTSISIVQGCMLMTVLAASQAYHYPDTYSVTDDVDEDEDDVSEEAPSKEDYTKYFSGSGSAISPHVTQPAADSSAGFVQPIDFSHLFAGGSFGSPDTVRGIVAPPTANNVFAIHAAPVIQGFIPGLIPGIATSATNNNHSSHIGFIHPNPNIELQALFDSARATTGPIYQRQPYISQYPHPAAIIGQPVSSYSMYLPHFDSIKNSGGRDVLAGQHQASQASHNSNHKMNPQRSADEDEYYDNQEDDDESEEGNEGSTDNGNDEEDTYTYEQTQQRKPSRQASPSEPRPEKSRYPKKQHSDTGKKSAFQNPYPYKQSEPSARRPNQKQNKGMKTTGPNKKGLISSERDHGYTSGYDYPTTSSDSRSIKKQKHIRHQPNQATSYRPVAAYYNKQMPSGSRLHHTNKDFSHVPYPHNEPTIFPTFPLSTRNKQLGSNSQPITSIYSYNTKPANSVPLQGGFVPSAPIPYAKDFPSSYRIPYTSPVSPMEALPSSIRPSDPQIKADSSEASKNTKKCIKIEKQPGKDGNSNSPGMICYKCHDVTTGANYEQCSYDSQSKSKPFYETEFEALKAEKNVKQISPRNKRWALQEQESSDGPYEFSFSRGMNRGQSVTLIRKVRQYTEYDDTPHTYETPYSTEESDNYRFGPEYFVNSDDSPEESDATEEVAESEAGEQCRRVKKDGIVCMVCQKPTGGTYEQCSYGSDPKENSYAYGKSSSYSHGSKPQAKRNRRYSGSFHSPDIFGSKQYRKRNVRNDHNFKRDESTNEPAEHVEEEYDEAFDVPEDFSESVAKIRKADTKGKLVGLDPFFYGSADETFHPEETKSSVRIDEDRESDEVKASTSRQPSYDDYFARLFPELETEATEKKKTASNIAEGDDYDSPEDYSQNEDEGETRNLKKKLDPGFQARSDIPDYFDDTEQRKDLEMVLGEFKQKDRSSCRKVIRDKMTCYQCLDDKGMQHEECMFVAASEPKNKHLAYHEVKQFRLAPQKNPQSVNKIEDSLNRQTPTIPDKYDGLSDTNIEATADNDHLMNQRSITDSTLNPEPSTPLSANIDNDSHAAENLDILRLYPKDPNPYPVSTVTIQNQRYFSSTGLPKSDSDVASSNTRRKRLPMDEIVASESKHTNRHSSPPNHDEDYEDDSPETRNNVKKNHQETSKKPYNAIPTDPPQFDNREGPEGAYSDDTEPAFDTVLKITLPRYMLDRSEHEAVFDEVLASG